MFNIPIGEIPIHSSKKNQVKDWLFEISNKNDSFYDYSDKNAKNLLKVLLLYGCSGSGKSTLVETLICNHNECVNSEENRKIHLTHWFDSHSSSEPSVYFENYDLQDEVIRRKYTCLSDFNASKDTRIVGTDAYSHVLLVHDPILAKTHPKSSVKFWESALALRSDTSGRCGVIIILSGSEYSERVDEGRLVSEVIPAEFLSRIMTQCCFIPSITVSNLIKVLESKEFEGGKPGKRKFSRKNQDSSLDESVHLQELLFIAENSHGDIRQSLRQLEFMGCAALSTLSSSTSPTRRTKPSSTKTTKDGAHYSGILGVAKLLYLSLNNECKLSSGSASSTADSKSAESEEDGTTHSVIDKVVREMQLSADQLLSFIQHNTIGHMRNTFQFLAMCQASCASNDDYNSVETALHMLDVDTLCMESISNVLSDCSDYAVLMNSSYQNAIQTDGYPEDYVIQACCRTHAAKKGIGVFELMNYGRDVLMCKSSLVPIYASKQGEYRRQKKDLEVLGRSIARSLRLHSESFHFVMQWCSITTANTSLSNELYEYIKSDAFQAISPPNLKPTLSDYGVQMVHWLLEMGHCKSAIRASSTVEDDNVLLFDDIEEF